MSFLRAILSPRLFVFACLALLIASAAAPDGPTISPVAATTIAEVGRTRILAFRTIAPAAQDSSFAVTVENADLLEVLIPPTLLQGQSLGYLRVRGLKAGETRLTVGDGSMTVKVVPPRIASESSRPHIVVPATGAVIWGSFAVGVEIDEEPFDGKTNLELRLSDGKSLAPVRESGPALGPTRHAVFEIPEAALAPGSATLTPVARGADGGEIAGEPVVIRVVAPQPGAVTAFEAEDPGEGKRPDRFGKEKPGVGVDPDASGQQYAGNWGSDPAVCCPAKIPETGLYQVMIRARGTSAGGAYPTVGLIVDNGDNPVTNSCLVDDRWQRIPLGVPVRLEAGARTLTPYFTNDFYAENLADRNLALDRVEVLRVDAPSAPALPALGTGKGGMAMASMGMGMGHGGRRGALRLAFVKPLQGRALQGAIEINGVCQWEGMDHVAPPRVTLLVNGKPFGIQRTAAPRFWVEAGAFVPGANTFQFQAALDDGAEAESPVHTLTWAAPAAGPRNRAFLRFPMHDEAWDSSIREHWRDKHGPAERSAAEFWANGEAILNLPTELTGTYEILVEGCGDDYEGPPIVSVRLEAGEKPVAVGEMSVHTWWDTVRIGKIELPAGSKRLVFAFINDKYKEKVGDRNLMLQAAILVPANAEPDAAPPVARIVYPPAGQAVDGLDAVVAEAWDDCDLMWVELLVDGRPTGVRIDTHRKPGPLVFPLIARGLAPGAHTLAVRACDGENHVADTPAQPFTALDHPPEHPGVYARAVRLLDRFAYGAEPMELAAVLAMGEKAWLEDRLSRGFELPGDIDALDHGVALFPNRDSDYDVMGRVVEHVLTTTNPVRARFVQWVENHFSTWIRKAGAELEWPEHQTFLRLGPAPFGDLLFASAHSPAMLRYLDAQQSFAHRLNENYAREIMELHTVGVKGGYAQADVTVLAALLTGWTFAEEGDGSSAGPLRRRAFRYDPQLGDGAACRFFGMDFPKAAPDIRYDRARTAIELLAAHPSTARFICRQLAEHYVGLPAPDALVEDTAKVFLETGGDFKAVLLAIAAHPAFRDAPVADKVCSPFDFAVRLSRMCGEAQPWGVIEFCQRSGMGVMDRPTPDGYPEDDSAYTDTNALLQRWRFVRQGAWALAQVVPGEWRWSDRPWTEAEKQSLSDVMAARLTGRLLSDSSNRAFLDLIGKAAGGRDAIVQQCAAFVAQMPEANLR